MSYCRQSKATHQHNFIRCIFFVGGGGGGRGDSSVLEERGTFMNRETISNAVESLGGERF